MNTKTAFLTLMLAIAPLFQAAALTHEEEIEQLKKEHSDAIAQLIKSSENPVDQMPLAKWLSKAGGLGCAYLTGLWSICSYSACKKGDLLQGIIWTPFAAAAGFLTIRSLVDRNANNKFLNKRILRQDKTYQKKLAKLHAQYMSQQKATV